MKSIKVLLITVLLPALAFSQSTQDVKLPHFDKLKVTNQITVYLTQGEAEMARIVAKGIELDDIITEVNAKTLEITLKRGVYKDISVEVYLTYRELRDVSVSGSGRVSFQTVLEGDKVVLNALTNGEIDAKLNLRTLDVTASKGGSIRLEGRLGSYEARVLTAGILSAFDLQADSAFVNISTKGIAKVSAKDLLDANVRTGATLTIQGSPNVKRVKTGVGATVLEQ